MIRGTDKASIFDHCDRMLANLKGSERHVALWRLIAKRILVFARITSHEECACGYSTRRRKDILGAILCTTRCEAELAQTRRELVGRWRYWLGIEECI
jgi:hypothetical protein